MTSGERETTGENAEVAGDADALFWGALQRLSTGADAAALAAELAENAGRLRALAHLREIDCGGAPDPELLAMADKGDLACAVLRLAASVQAGGAPLDLLEPRPEAAAGTAPGFAPMAAHALHVLADRL